jgi:hypothetical protein
MNASEIMILVKAKDEASRVLKGVEGQASSLGRVAGTVMKAGLLAGAAGALALGGALVSSVKDAIEAQNVMKQTETVLKSTGGASGLTAIEINKMAGALQRVTPFADETIQSGQNMLLTFTNIGKDIFPQATEAMLNMSQVLEQDVSTSAIQLGKALNDPIRGVTALRRVGVQLNEQQEAQIKAMVEAGNVAGAQAVILRELEVEFGNSARAAGETFAGKMKILGNQISEVKEGIGMALLPALTKLADLANQRLVPAIQDGVTALQNFGDFIGAALANDVNNAAAALNKLPGPLRDLALWLIENKPQLDDMVERVQTLAGVVKDLAEDALQGWVDILTVLMPPLRDFGKWLMDHEPILIALAIAIGLVVVALAPWPLALASVTFGVGILVVKLQEWRKECELLDGVLDGIEQSVNAITFALAPFIDAIGLATQFVSDHRSVQIVLAETLALTLLPLTLLVAGLYALGRAGEVATAIMAGARQGIEFLRERVYWLRDAFWSLRDAVESAVGKLNVFDNIGGAIGGVASRLARGAGFAEGGWASGLALVGERGPELVDFGPQRAFVHNNTDTRRMLAQPAGNTNHVTIYVTAHDPQGVTREIDRYFRGMN